MNTYRCEEGGKYCGAMLFALAPGGSFREVYVITQGMMDCEGDQCTRIVGIALGREGNASVTLLNRCPFCGAYVRWDAF